jgi:hypothetical protein
MRTKHGMVGLVVIVLAALVFVVVAAATITGGFSRSISTSSAITFNPGVTYYDS